jgi:hypothetical protein
MRVVEIAPGPTLGLASGMSDPILHDPGNTQKIDEVYVFMSIDEHGHNGLVAEILPRLGTTLLVTGSRNAAGMMQPLAQEIAKRSGKPVGLFRFTRDTQLWQSD